MVSKDARIRQETTVVRLLGDLEAANSKENALYYLQKFEAYLQSSGKAKDLDDLMQKRANDPQGQVSHWEIMRNFLHSSDMSSAAYTTLKNAAASIRNWYSVNNQALQDRKVKFPRERKRQRLPAPMTLKQVRDLVINGKLNAEMKAILLIALQSGMGRSEILSHSATME